MKNTTEAGYRKRIARVVAAIIADPTAPHTVEDLAAIAHFSPFHFHRLYRAPTGEGVAETVCHSVCSRRQLLLSTEAALMTTRTIPGFAAALVWAVRALPINHISITVRRL
ncbi:MAG TPA: hypothetical protein VNT30_03960 [Stellaceae bacterium]|nr:hypothetical protein [Stellaceae bacterium]